VHAGEICTGVQAVAQGRAVGAQVEAQVQVARVLEGEVQAHDARVLQAVQQRALCACCTRLAVPQQQVLVDDFQRVAQPRRPVLHLHHLRAHACTPVGCWSLFK
jgi:hypothetical protein